MGTKRQTCKILQLSDCTMMYILSYLDATSLFNLSRTCLYFKNIVEDPRLWKFIEARHEPNSSKKVQYVCERVNEKTTHLLMRAESKYNGLIQQDFLMAMGGLQYLTVLALENQRIDGKIISLSDFPKGLGELSLKKTHVKSGKQFFQGSYSIMRNLKVLILDECDWVDSNFFMSIAKYENLEILSIIKCMKLHLNVIPYLSVARHGCRKLRVIDCRFSTVGNDILRTFDSKSSLLAVYFQSMSSYQLDMGTSLLKCPPLSSDYKDLILQSTIKDRSLEQFKFVIGDLVEELPESLLYQDPYPECTCGYKDEMNEGPSSVPNESTEPTRQPISRSMPIDDYIDFHFAPQKFICRRHVRELNKLPKDFKNFFYQNQKNFYPDSSDNDSDSDDDGDCCMFGVGKSQQMIVLKVREVDNEGNIPEPEIINIDIDVSEGSIVQRPCDINDCQAFMPSTSRANHDDSEQVQNTAKRKADDGDNSENQKKAKLDDRSQESTSRGRTSPVPGPSRSRDNHEVPDPPEATPGPSKVQTFPIARIEVPRLEDFVRVVPMVPRGDLIQVGRHPHVNKIKLRRLSLRGYTEITDQALFSLRNLSLDLLDVTYTGVTKPGVEKFLTINPNCRVIHEDYCTCKPRIPC